MELVRSAADAVEVIGLDEAYLDLSGMPAPRAQMRRLARAIEQRTGLGCSIGIGPSKLVAKVASDAEKPRGFVVLTAEQAASRFAPSDAGSCPGSVPRPRSACAPPGWRRSASWPPRRPSGCDRSSARGSARSCAAGRGFRMTARSPSSARWSRSHGRRRSTPTWRRWPSSSRCCRRWWRSSATGSSVSAAAGARSGSRSASMTSPPTPGPGRWPSRSGSADRVGPVALELLRQFAPPRPVRLLGVRVAGLHFTGDAVGAQLTLALYDAQYSAAASRRRPSRASGLSTPSSSRIPTITRRMSSREPSALGSAPIRRSSARSWSPSSSAREGLGDLGDARAVTGLERDPRGQSVGREAARYLADERQRAIAVAPGRAGSAPAALPRSRSRARA